MTSLAFVLALSAPPTPDQLLAKAQALYKKPLGVVVSVNHRELSPLKKLQGVYRLEISGTNARMSVGNLVYTVYGNNGYIQDLKNNEYVIENAGSPSNNVGPRLEKLAKEIPDNVKIVSDTSFGSDYFKQLRMVKTFTVSSVGKSWRISSNSSETRYELDFEKATNRVQRIYIIGRGLESTTQYSYGNKVSPIGKPKLVGNKVNTLTPRADVPKYKTERAKNLSNAVLKRYSNLRSLSYSVSGAGGSANVSFEGNKIRCKQGEWLWVHDGTSITILNNKTRQFWRTACAPKNVLYRLSQARVPVETMLRNRLEGKNMVANLFPGLSEVRNTLKYGTKGRSFEVLEVTLDNLKLNLEVRTETALVTQVKSVLTQGNKALRSNTSDITYYLVNEKIPDKNFQLSIPLGYREMAFAKQ